MCRPPRKHGSVADRVSIVAGTIRVPSAPYRTRSVPATGTAVQRVMVSAPQRGARAALPAGASPGEVDWPGETIKPLS